MTGRRQSTKGQQHERVNWWRWIAAVLSFVVALLSLFKSINITAIQTDKNKNNNNKNNNDALDLPSPTFTEAKTKTKTKTTIGYAVSITKCQPSDIMIDQAAVLIFSIHKNSSRNPLSGSKYDYHAYAFVHPEASNCAEALERIGYEVLIRNNPVEKNDIKGNLRKFVHEASCCAEKEFLKLYAYTLVQHPIVTHIDLDSLILKPMDNLYDSMLEGPASSARERLPAMWINNASLLPKDIEGVFTRDYNLVEPGRRKPHEIGVQGGFLVVKPNTSVFDKYVAVIQEGNFTRFPGWGAPLRYGGYYGAAQIQGLCAYFFGHVRPGTTVELNRCYYNAMVDNPKQNNKCRTLQETCQDCRITDFDQIITTHYTVCSKPWWCTSHERAGGRKTMGGDATSSRLCTKTHHAWFRTRLQLEKTWSSKLDSYNVTFDDDVPTQTYGICGPTESGPRYRRLPLPTTQTDFGNSGWER